MATSIPFVTVSINRFGFSVLKVKINLADTDKPKEVAVNMVMNTIGKTAQDDHDYIGEWYSYSLTDDANENGAIFFMGDNLIEFKYEVLHDNI